MKESSIFINKGTFVNALLYHLGMEAADLLPIDPNHSNAQLDDEDGDDKENLLDLPETPEAAKQTPQSLRPV